MGEGEKSCSFGKCSKLRYQLPTGQSDTILTEEFEKVALQK